MGALKLDELTYHVVIDPDLAKLIPNFVKNRHKDLQLLQAAEQDQKLDEIQGIGHSLKGSCGGYGFDELGWIGAQIEIEAKNKSWSSVRGWIKEYENYLHKMKIES